MRVIWLLLFVLNTSALANSNSKKIIDFSLIKDVIKSDGLKKRVEKIQIKSRKSKAQKQEKIDLKFQVPGEKEFWSFFSEYWMIKNRKILQWDFEKPDFGITSAFNELLDQLEIKNKSFKIMLINSPVLTHFALPANINQYIFILSLPFLREAKLSNMDIAALLLEDMIRSDLGFMKKSILYQNKINILGASLKNPSINNLTFEKLLKRYDEKIYEKGYSFQEQFLVTKETGKIVGKYKKINENYISMLSKIDIAIKSGHSFSQYNKIYPSPEMQLKWLERE